MKMVQTKLSLTEYKVFLIESVFWINMLNDWFNDSLKCLIFIRLEMYNISEF